MPAPSETFAATTLGAPPERWLEAFRAAVERQRELFAEAPTSGERTVYEGIGEGGDRTLEIDRLCEEAILDELGSLADEGHSFTVISEERGTETFGEGGPLVVIDPIDGSLNARRTLPHHSLSVAVATGPTVADVELGFVHDFGPGDEYLAIRGEGASLNGRPITAREPEDVEIVGLEAVEPGRALPVIAALDGVAYRIRVIGSIAISMCMVAARRMDAMLSCRETRSVDVAAGALIVREAGGAVSFGDLDADAASLELDARYPVAAAAGEGTLAAIAPAFDRVGR